MYNIMFYAHASVPLSTNIDVSHVDSRSSSSPISSARMHASESADNDDAQSLDLDSDFVIDGSVLGSCLRAWS